MICVNGLVTQPSGLEVFQAIGAVSGGIDNVYASLANARRAQRTAVLLGTGVAAKRATEDLARMVDELDGSLDDEWRRARVQFMATAPADADAAAERLAEIVDALDRVRSAASRRPGDL